MGSGSSKAELPIAVKLEDKSTEELQQLTEVRMPRLEEFGSALIVIHRRYETRGIYIVYIRYMWSI